MIDIPQLSGNQLSALPPEIGNLSSLRQFSVRLLLIVMSQYEFIINFSHSKQLQANKLTRLPPEIGQLSDLSRLWVRLRVVS